MRRRLSSLALTVLILAGSHVARLPVSFNAAPETGLYARHIDNEAFGDEFSRRHP